MFAPPALNRQNGDTHVCAYHMDFAMSEIAQVQNSINERIAQGDEGIYGTHDEAIRQLLRKYRKTFKSLWKRKGGSRASLSSILHDNVFLI